MGSVDDDDASPNELQTLTITRRTSSEKPRPPIVEETITNKSANLGADEGLVKWLEEEVQLLIELRDQGRDWDEIYEVSQRRLFKSARRTAFRGEI